MCLIIKSSKGSENVSTTIEQLELEILSDSTSATNGIEALASSLGKLRTASKGGLGLSSISKQLTSLNTSLTGINRTNTDTLERLADSLQRLSTIGNLKISPTLATQITSIGSAVSSIEKTNFSPVETLVSTLTPLSTIGKSNLNSFISQLNRLPSAINALESSLKGSVDSEIRELVAALSPLTQMGKSNLGTFLNQLKKIPEISASLKATNFRELYNQINSLVRIMRPLADEMWKVAQGFSAFPAKIQRLIRGTNNLAVANNTTATSYLNLAAKAGAAAIAIRGIARVIAGWVTESNKYIEDLNLFNASMGEYAGEAQKYAERVGDVMGIDPAEWMRNQGIFMTLATGFGVAGDRANYMSKNLTQLGYDISSFFNIGYEDAFQKLQSGLAGELEPLRRLGYDLSAARLQQEAYTLGIEKNVNAMTQAEKAELRYYAIMTQVTHVQGDMARTLDAPANQLRILKAQVVQAARALGNIFIPILKAVLPYAIAVAKVIKVVADIIGKLVGFKLVEVDYSGVSSSVGGAADNADKFADGMGTAAKKAKEVKKALLGIDELNVISPEENSGGSGGGAGEGFGGGGFDFELPGYDFIKDAVSTQVDEIVAKMKEWLGITDDIDSWAELFDTRLGKILTTVGAVAAALGTWKIAKGIVDFINTLSNFKGFTVPNAAFAFLTFLSDLNMLIQKLEDIAVDGASFDNVVGAISEFAGMLGDAFVILGKTKLGAAFKVIQGVGEIISAIQNISENGFNVDNVLYAIRGISNIMIGIGLLSEKHRKLAGVGLVLQGITGIIQELAKNWEAIKQGDWSGVDKVALLIGAVEAVSGLLMVLNVFPRLKLNSNISNSITTANKAITSTGSLGETITKTAPKFKLPSVKTILLGIADVSLIIGGTIVLIEAIGLLMKIPGFEQTAKEGIDTVAFVFKGLGKIIAPLLVISAGMVVLGKIKVPSVAKGFAGFSIIVGGISVLITAIGALISIPYFSEFLDTGIASVIAVVTGLTEVAQPLAGMSALIVALGFATPGVIGAGLAGFAIVIGGLELVLVALGALQQIPGFSWIVGEGGKVLVQLGEVLGGFAGSIVNGMLSEVSNAFPQIGQNLANFMTNAQPFFTGLESVDAEAIEAVKKLAQMVLILTAADVLDGLTSWFTGGNSLSDFGNDLAEFAPKFVAFSRELSGGDIKPEVVEAAATAAQAMAELSNNLPNSGGLVAFFTGDNDIDQWGAKLAQFGKYFVQFYGEIKQAQIEPGIVDAAATAAKTMVELSNNVPTSGGLIEFFTGNNDIDKWGARLKTFGKCFVDFYNEINKTQIEPGIVNTAATAAQTMVELSNNVPSSGGLINFFTGSNDIGLWGAKLALFGKFFASFYNEIKDAKIDSEIVNTATNAAQALVALSNNVPKNGGLVGFFTGDNDVDKWGAKLPAFGRHIAAYSDSLSGVDAEKLASISSEMKEILGWASGMAKVDAEAVEAFGKALKQLGNDFADCADNIVDGFNERFKASYSTTMEYVQAWRDDILTQFTTPESAGINELTFADKANSIITGFNTEVNSTHTSSQTCISDWKDVILTSFVSGETGAVNPSTFSGYADGILTGFNGKINTSYASTDTPMKLWTDNIHTAFTDSKVGNVNASTFKGYGAGIVTGFGTGVTNNVLSTQENMTGFASSVLGWFTASVSNDGFYKIASDVVNGFKKGIGALYETTKGIITSWASSIIGWFKKPLESNSPSRVFKNIGCDTVAGYNIGIEDAGKSTRKVVTKWAESFTDVTPTISLSVDTTDLKYYNSSEFAKNFSTSVNKRVSVSASTSVTGQSAESLMAKSVSSANESQNALLREQNDLLRQILSKTGVYLDGKEITNTVEKTQRERGASILSGGVTFGV